MNNIKDKSLVWFYNDYQFARRSLGFYDAQNESIFSYDGKRTQNHYEHYEPFKGEIPEWAQHAYSQLEK